MRRFIFIAAFVAALAGISGAADPGSFRFVILGDRTGETQPGVYERVWKETAADHPAFVVTVGDTIQGLNDATADAEWQEIQRILTPYRRLMHRKVWIVEYDIENPGWPVRDDEFQRL